MKAGPQNGTVASEDEEEGDLSPPREGTARRQLSFTRTPVSLTHSASHPPDTMTQHGALLSRCSSPRGFALRLADPPEQFCVPPS